MGDRFESEYMASDGSVRFRDKRVSRTMPALLGAPAVFTWVLAAWIGASNATAARPVPGTALPFVVGALVLFGLMFALLALSFAVLRTVLTDDKLVVKYGLWGPEIDLATIKSSRVVDYQWTEYGGWGIRIGKDGSRAYVPASGEVVEVVYDDAGAAKKVLIGAQDARGLSLAINRARSGAGARIATDDVAAEEEALAEEEAEQSREARR